MTELTIILILLLRIIIDSQMLGFYKWIILTGKLLPKMETYEISVPYELVNDSIRNSTPLNKTDESTKTLEDDISVEMEKFPLPQKLPPTLRSKLSPIITAKMATK